MNDFFVGLFFLFIINFIYVLFYLLGEQRKNKYTVGIIALFFNGLGFHRAYLGNFFIAILYLLFCWTLIPTFIGIIEGFYFLFIDEDKFNQKYNNLSPTVNENNKSLKSFVFKPKEIETEKIKLDISKIEYDKNGFEVFFSVHNIGYSKVNITFTDAVFYYKTSDNKLLKLPYFMCADSYSSQILVKSSANFTFPYSEFTPNDILTLEWSINSERNKVSCELGNTIIIDKMKKEKKKKDYNSL